MSSVAELPGEWTQWGRAKKTANEYIAVILACLSLVLSIVSMVVTLSYAMYLESRVTEQQDSLDIYRIRSAKLNAWLAANGIPIDEVYDE